MFLSCFGGVARRLRKAAGAQQAPLVSTHATSPTSLAVRRSSNEDNAQQACLPQSIALELQRILLHAPVCVTWVVADTGEVIGQNQVSKALLGNIGDDLFGLQHTNFLECICNGDLVRRPVHADA